MVWWEAEELNYKADDCWSEHTKNNRDALLTWCSYNLGVLFNFITYLLLVAFLEGWKNVEVSQKELNIELPYAEDL